MALWPWHGSFVSSREPSAGLGAFGLTPARGSRVPAPLCLRRRGSMAAAIKRDIGPHAAPFVPSRGVLFHRGSFAEPTLETCHRPRNGPRRAKRLPRSPGCPGGRPIGRSAGPRTARQRERAGGWRGGGVQPQRRSRGRAASQARRTPRPNYKVTGRRGGEQAGIAALNAPRSPPTKRTAGGSSCRSSSRELLASAPSHRRSRVPRPAR